MITAKIQAIFIKTNIADFLLPFLPFPKTLCYIPLQAPHINGWAVSRADFKTTRQNGIYPYTCPAIITMLYSAPFWDYFPSTFQFKKACCFFFKQQQQKAFSTRKLLKTAANTDIFPYIPKSVMLLPFCKGRWHWHFRNGCSSPSDDRILHPRPIPTECQNPFQCLQQCFEVGAIAANAKD